MDAKLRDMQLIIAVVEEGSVSKAAEKLSTTQSSATRTVAKVEHDLGIALFDKTDYPWRLTDAGLLFVKKSRAILNTETKFLKDVQNLLKKKSGHFSVGLMALEEKYLIPTAITKFTAQNPTLYIEFISTLPMSLESALTSDVIDNALIAFPTNNQQLECIPILTHNFFLALPANHPLAKGYVYPKDGVTFPAIDLKSLADFPFILPKSTCFIRNNIIELCQSVGFSPKGALETDFMETAKSLVCLQQGAAFLFSYFVNNHDDSIVYFKIKDRPLLLTIAFAYKKGKKLSLGEQAFLDILLEENKS